jgi:6-phosphogluconolactonase
VNQREPENATAAPVAREGSDEKGVMHSIDDIWVIPCRDARHTASEAARAALDAFVRAKERDFACALSGGRTAALVFAELVRQAGLRSSPLDAIDYFWADERCVPPDHEESNFRIARTTLLERAGVPPERIHRLEGELPPPNAVARANADWDRWLLRRLPKRRALDCALLGVGEDGHIASLFPTNIHHDLASADPYRAVVGPKPPPQRITMGYRILSEAALVIVVSSGAEKADMIRRSVRGAEDTPLARLLAQRAGRPTIVIGPGL